MSEAVILEGSQRASAGTETPIKLPNPEQTKDQNRQETSQVTTKNGITPNEAISFWYGGCSGYLNICKGPDGKQFKRFNGKWFYRLDDPEPSSRQEVCKFNIRRLPPG